MNKLCVNHLDVIWVMLLNNYVSRPHNFRGLIFCSVGKLFAGFLARWVEWSFFLFIYWRVGKGATPRLFILFISFYVRPKRSPVERLLNFL